MTFAAPSHLSLSSSVLTYRICISIHYPHQAWYPHRSGAGATPVLSKLRDSIHTHHHSCSSCKTYCVCFLDNTFCSRMPRSTRVLSSAVSVGTRSTPAVRHAPARNLHAAAPHTPSNGLQNPSSFQSPSAQ